MALVRFHGYDPSTRREAEALREAGMEVYVLCLAGQTEIDGAVHRPLEVVDGVHVRRFRISKRRGGPATYAWQWGCWFVACFVALTVLHARRRLRVIQVSSLPDFQVFAALVPKLTGCRVVFFQKEPFPELFATITGRTTLSKLLAVVERLAIRFADRTLTVTEQLRQTSVARGADGNRIGVVLNATPRAAWAPAVARSAAHDGEFVVLCAGTIEERYGHVHLAEAVAIARRSLPNIRLVVTGSGTAVPAFQARVSALGIDDCVDYLGWVSDAVLAEQFARADVGVVAQLANSYSHLVHTTKMFEYFEAGIPVIASRLRATARSYGEDTIAYYEPGDAADLARRLVELGSDPARCRDLADHGHAAIARDGWPEQAKRYVGAFAEVLGAIPAPVG